MSGSGAGPLVPTFHGFVQNSMDGLLLFEACLSGKLHHVPRRPHDRERASLIKSGSIFIYEENASGIKRWTDGVAWSPSRILGNFLIYRELEKPFPPGEKKRAMKRKRTGMPGEPFPRRASHVFYDTELSAPLTPPSPNDGGGLGSELPSSDQDKELERSLIGSLVDSYGFRPDGLVKKTMSVSVSGISHHMVSYYKVDDVKNNLLPRPLSDPRLQNISVRPELYLKQNFRAPVEETEQYAIDGQMHAHPQMMYSSMTGGYSIRPGQYIGQPYTSALNGPQGATTTGIYGAVTGASWPTQQASAGTMAYGSHPGYASQTYGSQYYRPTTNPTGAPGVKAEDQQTSSSANAYGGPYSSAYSSVPRNGASSTPNMMQSAYQTPAQQTASSFGSISAHGGRPPYGNVMNSPSATISTQPQGAYTTASSQPYAVRSPNQGYTMQSAPSSAIAHSPHLSIKNTLSATHTSASAADQNAHLAYRTSSYPVQAPPSTHGGSDMNSLGVVGAHAYGMQSQSGQSYHAYGPPSQAFRNVGDSGHASAYAQ